MLRCSSRHTLTATMPSFGPVAEAEALSTATLAALCCATCSGVASMVSLSPADDAPAAGILLGAQLNGIGRLQGIGLLHHS